MSTLTAASRATLLSSWIKPSSPDEQVQQDRAERMIREAVTAHPAFRGVHIEVYAKGSYANNTNVRRDSDVDIVVENQDAFYYEFADGVVASPPIEPYTDIWAPDRWRTEVTRALANKFGAAGIDTTGSTAILVKAVAGSRPSTDVVPSYTYRFYTAADDGPWGTSIIKKDGNRIDNYPLQQLQNGRAKNTVSGGRYKAYARALKNAENELCRAGTINPLPSYLMECLAWNVPDHVLRSGDLDSGFRATLVWLWQYLTDDYVYEQWFEPNAIKYLFWRGQAWTLADAKTVVLGTWGMLGYA